MNWFRREPSIEKKASEELTKKLAAVKEKRKLALSELMEKLGDGAESNMVILTEELRTKAGGK